MPVPFFSYTRSIKENVGKTRAGCRSVRCSDPWRCAGSTPGSLPADPSRRPLACLRCRAEADEGSGEGLLNRGNVFPL